MLYKKSTPGRRYTRLITGSPVFFTAFVMLGAALFLFLTLTTQVDVIRTYAAGSSLTDREPVLFIKGVGIPAGKAYIFSDKNEAVFPVMIESEEPSGDYTTLHFDSEGQKAVRSLSEKKIFIDVVLGSETLLKRIFSGGKGHG